MQATGIFQHTLAEASYQPCCGVVDSKAPVLSQLAITPNTSLWITVSGNMHINQDNLG